MTTTAISAPISAPISAATVELLDRSRAGLLTATTAERAGERYIAAHLSALRAAAAVLTDRDGLYGAIGFVRACQRTGVAPLLGVDLAVRELGGDSSDPARRTPVRGGAVVDPRHPRVTVLALGSGAAPASRGWARLCRL